MDETPRGPAGEGLRPEQSSPPNNKAFWIVLALVGGFALFGCLILAALIYPAVKAARQFNAETNEVIPNTTNLANLDAVGKGCLDFAKDHKNHLPNLSNLASLERDLKPYSKYAAFISMENAGPMGTHPLSLNSKLSKADLTKMGHRDQKILAYSSLNSITNVREAAFADGQAREVTEPEFQADLKK
jgi:hypothetical protein